MRPTTDEHIVVRAIDGGYVAELMDDHTGNRVHPYGYATARTPETAFRVLTTYTLPTLPR